MADAAQSPPWFAGGIGTGIGSLPGTSAEEAARVVAGELPELPHLVELPDRGAGADMIGRAVGLLVDIAGEVVPSGWRISRRPGRDTRRAKDFLAWDVDAAALHYAGASHVKVQICGPWTLAAGLELPSGNRAVTDRGAVADLVDSLAEGLALQLGELEKRLPGAHLVVQIDEPGLPAVLAGRLPTASGFGTVSAVDAADARSVLAQLLAGVAAARRAGDPPPGDHIAHCCHRDAPLELFRAAGFGALSFDITAVGSGARRVDAVGEAVEAGCVLVAGVVPSARPAGRPVSIRQAAEPLLTLWNQLGLPRASLAQVVPTPTCGLAGADAEWPVVAMRQVREIARALQDLPEGW